MPRKTKPVPPRRHTTALPGARRTQPRVVSKNLVNNTELTLMMPVKPGFIPTRDTITYATRARLVMDAFHGFRQISREASTLHPFSDVVERISTIQSYRLALLENDTKLLLAVSFDQPWEPYIRRIWRDTGPFLDAILCNCVNYERYASENGFEAFSKWVRETQIESDFFYIADNLSVEDRSYLDMTERRQREGSAQDRELDIARARLADLEAAAEAERRHDPAEAIATGLRALGVLYRLGDYYPKVSASRDHQYYHHAVRRLLHGFDPRGLPDHVKAAFKAEIAWFLQNIQPPPRAKQRKFPRTGDIQAGILQPYRKISHGVMLLMRVKDLPNATKFIANLPITAIGEEPRRGNPCYNIAFTYNGLVQLQADPQSLEDLPQEFREGMAARAGMLGDVRTNHPSKWNLPERYSAQGCASERETPVPNTSVPNTPVPKVQTSSVDFVIQLRVSRPKASYTTQWDQSHPLYNAVTALAELPGWSGVQMLSLQPMAHLRDQSGRYKNRIREHFGFIDGISQPDIKDNPNLDSDGWNNDAALGDLLLGHGNSYADPPYKSERQGSFTDNGTFLVIRKLRQDVGALHDLLPQDGQEQSLAKMMGRRRNGQSLVRSSSSDGNTFDFSNDKQGDLCPIHAHIRRANPRQVQAVIGDDRGGTINIPRIVRRGMSYGPRYDARNDTNKPSDRGLVFMAYNASIAEQFEVIQRWISGGNSSGGYSGQSDPFLGVPERGKQRSFRYVDDGEVVSQPLDDPDNPHPLVKLEWGLYLFVPSMRTLQALTKPVGRPSLVSRGETIIRRLQRIEAEQALGFDRENYEVSAADRWKAVLEDLYPSAEENLDALWAAIRAKHNGVLRTPYGVLVGSEKLVREVFADDGRRYSVREYWWRLRKSFGDIYLSMDPWPKAFAGKDPSQPRRQRPYHHQVTRGDYAKRANQINSLLNGFTEEWGFTSAYALASGFLNALQPLRGVQGNLRVRALVDSVLGDLAQAWFGIPDGKAILAAGEPTVTNPQSLHCPFHFIASSRYAFSPNPGPAAIAQGQDHGARLQQATEQWIRKLKGDPAANQTPIGGPMFEMLGHKPAQLASEMIGVMHGFLPSTLGNLLKAMLVWTADGNLWRMQEDYLAANSDDKLVQANTTLRDPLMRAMQYRPVPDQLHRIVVDKNIRLGRESLEPGDKVVIGIGSASAELLEKGKTAVTWVFGGDYYGKNAGAHGCPGQKMAMGVMLGVTAALLDAGQIRAEPAPLILTLI